MSGGKKTTTTSNQRQSATTTLPAWLTSAAQDNYGAAKAYTESGAMDWSPEKAAAYANPYVREVQDRTVARMGQRNEVERAGLDDNAQAAKAFGGTRHAVIEGAMRRDQGESILDYLAGSNADAYATARGEFNSDRAAKMGTYQSLASILQGAPRNTTTSGTSSGTSTEKSSGSFLDTLLAVGQIGASIYASDPRLKRDVTRIGRMANGLGIYRFRYLWDRATAALRTGVMANEVARIVPDALGPLVGGYLTVDYAKLGGEFT